MEIQKSMSFSAQLKDDNDVTYVNFNGSVDENAIPNVSYYVSHEDIYRANVRMFRTSLMEFQNAVFDEADAQMLAMEEDAPEADVEPGTDNAEVKAK